MTAHRVIVLALGGMCFAAAVASGCSGSPVSSVKGTEASWEFNSVEALPHPAGLDSTSLFDALAGRRSARQFTAEPLSAGDVSALLWAAQGVTAEWGGRSAPSAGALYPLEVYLVTDEGIQHYRPDGHQIEVAPSPTAKSELAEAIGQEPAADAPAVVVIAAVPQRVEPKYGGRAERYIALEAGHAAQNLLLGATALGLAGVPLGAFSDSAVADALGLPATQEVYYTIAIGHPDRTADRS